MSSRLAAAVAELVAALHAELQDDGTRQSDRLYDIPAAATELGGLGRTAIYGLISQGTLRSVSAGRRRFIPRSAIDEFIANQREAAGSMRNAPTAMEAGRATGQRPSSRR